MSLVRWTQPNFFPSVSSFFDGLLNEDEGLMRSVSTGTSLPAVNVVENDNSFVLDLAAPCKVKEDFKIEIDHKTLIISSEEEEEKESENKNFTRKEYSYNSFSRSFNLPENINQEGIEASYKDGILSVTLPKVEKTVKKVKSVSIN